MTGLYISGGLIVVAIVTLVVFKIRSSRAANVAGRARTEKMENERIEAVAKAEARRES